MKSVIPFLLFLFGLTVWSERTFAQVVNGDNLIPQNNCLIRLNFLGIPGVNIEYEIGKHKTISAETGLGWPVIVDEESEAKPTKRRIESLTNPYIVLEGRYYYNINNRISAGRSVENFSGNYIGPFYRFNAFEYIGSYEPDNTYRYDLLRNVHYVGFWWGMQRHIGAQKLFYFNFAFGPALKTDWSEYIDYSFTGKLALGMQWAVK